jgi:periplasmic protein TonB
VTVSRAPERDNVRDPRFDGLRSPRRSAVPLVLSGIAHAVLVATALLLSIFQPPALPPVPFDGIRVRLEGPPPPPPPPLPKGTGPIPSSGVRQPVTPSPPARALVAPQEPVALTPTPVPPGDGSLGVSGSETGSESGVPEGMEGGVPGGVIGGVPGGVLGGVIGGTGSGPVPASVYDQPARLIRQVKPVYPHDAFVARLEGTVVVTFLIDASGRVVNARVVESVPLLDAAALAAVRQWTFAPATHLGRPVPTLGLAPIQFRIY